MTRLKDIQIAVAFVMTVLFSPPVAFAESFQGLWQFTSEDKKNPDRVWILSHNLVQHEGIVCGEWYSVSPSQLDGGYIAGRVTKGILRAYQCHDSNQGGEFSCPNFDPSVILLAVKKGRLIDPHTNTGIEKRISEPRSFFLGDEVSEPFLSRCQQNANVLLRSTQ